MKISINEPCHENWEAMTPNQQGAFCGSCQKNVVDFSKKTIEDIKSFFSKPQGKVCGRFEETQLQELSFDDFFSRFKYWNFSKKFAVIFFLAFGFWIFSGNAAMAQSHHLKGEVEFVPEKPKPVQKDTVKMIGQAVVKPVSVKMGKIKCVKPETPIKKETPKEIKKDPPMIMGDIGAPILENKPISEPVEKKQKPIDPPRPFKSEIVPVNNNETPTIVPKERKD